MTVSRQLGIQLNLTQFLPVYGVASDVENRDSASLKFAGETIKVLYGGAIMPDTGLDLFYAAVRQLAATEPDLPLEFVITGNFPEVEIRRFAREIEALSTYKFTIEGDLSAADYRRLARGIDIGLCLKLPSRSMGQTTFPSKVIEYASFGMLVCSTSVSDVAEIFADTAIILATESPEELAASLAGAARDRQGSARRGQAGRERIHRRYSRQAVGRDLLSFLDRGACSTGIDATPDVV